VPSGPIIVPVIVLVWRGVPGPEAPVINPARRDSYLETHVIVCGDRCADRMERWPSRVWGSVVEMRDDRIIRQWRGERGWSRRRVRLNPRRERR
jgi:hypothetical protein